MMMPFPFLKFRAELKQWSENRAEFVHLVANLIAAARRQPTLAHRASFLWAQLHRFQEENRRPSSKVGVKFPGKLIVFRPR